MNSIKVHLTEQTEEPTKHSSRCVLDARSWPSPFWCGYSLCCNVPLSLRLKIGKQNLKTVFAEKCEEQEVTPVFWERRREWERCCNLFGRTFSCKHEETVFLPQAVYRF